MMNTIQRYFIALALVLNLCGITISLYRMFNYGYLGPPFFWDSNDTFMDFFNTYYWSFDSERYTIWESIYLPISFVFFQTFGNISCTHDGAQYLRDCDFESILYLVCLACLSIFATNLFYKRKVVELSRQDRFLLSSFLATSFPFLFAIERGNLVLIAYLFFVLYLSGPNRIRGGGYLAMAVLFKPYLLICYWAVLLKSNTIIVVSQILILICVFLFFNYVLDDINVHLILKNLSSFSAAEGYSYFEKLPYTTSSKMWLKLFNDEFRSVIVENYFGGAKDLIVVFVDFLAVIVYFAAIYSVVMTFAYKKKLDIIYILYVILLSFLAVTDSAGPYGLLFIVPLAIFISIKFNFQIIFYVVVILSLLLDPVYIYSETLQINSYFMEFEILVERGLTIGSLIRPILIGILTFLNLYYINVLRKRPGVILP